MDSIQITGVTGSDYDDLLREFPIVSEHVRVIPGDDSPVEDQEMGSINILLELAPDVLEFSAALLIFLAARYDFKKRDRD